MSTVVESMPATTPSRARAVALTHQAALVAPGYGSLQGWDLIQRQARALAASDLVPPQFRDNVPNCILAIDVMIQQRVPLMTVLQNLVIINGLLSWKTVFLIGQFNRAGRFTALRYQRTADSCRCWVRELATGDRLEGPLVTVDMAKRAGWYDRKGSQWKTAAELMLGYRAAAWLIRQTAPELTMGLPTEDELRDRVDYADANVVSEPVRHVRDYLQGAPTPPAAPPVMGPSGEPDPSSGEAQSHEGMPEGPTPGNEDAGLGADTYAAVRTRIERCDEIDLLDLMADDVGDLPEPQRGELLTLVDARRATLLERAGL